MGGFMLFEGDTPVRILLPDDLEELVEKGEIDFPRITEKEIQDRSKGDLISKGLVVVQTTWFLLQCLARGVERLPITELEVVALAYATLNCATYAIWWNKPLNVQCSFRIYKISATRGSGASDGERREGARHDSADGATSCLGEEIASIALLQQDRTHRESACNNGIDKNNTRLRAHIIAFMRRVWRAMKRPNAEDSEPVWVTISIAPFLPFAYMAGWYEDIEFGVTKVPTYYSGTDGHPMTLTFIVPSIATIFGAIHCIPWSYEFPSLPERFFWRASSLALTCLPFTELFLAAVRGLLTDNLETGRSRVDCISGYSFQRFLVLLIVTFSITYVLARLDLLVQAFISLRALPPGAYETVHWTTLIPHI